MIGFIIGVFVGTFLGMLVMSMCVVSKRADDLAEEMQKKEGVK